MNTQDGSLITPEVFQALEEQARKQYVEVKRDLSAKEQFDMQIRMYAPCGCGSGKKFKFCCHVPAK